MSIISKPFTFSAGATIIASEHNANWDTLLSDYNGNITNSNISGSAAIDYSKLSLATSIVNADVSASAAIVASKLDLTSPGPIGSVARNSGAFTTFAMGTTRQGDILFDNGTSFVRLAAGTSGNFLKTLGSGANPQWAIQLINIYSAGTGSQFLLANNPTERSFNGAVYTKLKQISSIQFTGNIDVSVDAKSDSSPGVVRLYINDVASGAAQNVTSSYVTYFFTASVVSGDNVQIYMNSNSGSDTQTARNLKVYGIFVNPVSAF